MNPYTYAVTALADDIATGTVQTTDSNGADVSLGFSFDFGTKTIQLALATRPRSYPTYNTRILATSASDSEVGFVFVVQSYEHNVMTEVQASKHWWSPEDFKAFRADLVASLTK